MFDSLASTVDATIATEIPDFLSKIIFVIFESDIKNVVLVAAGVIFTLGCVTTNIIGIIDGHVIGEPNFVDVLVITGDMNWWHVRDYILVMNDSIGGESLLSLMWITVSFLRLAPHSTTSHWCTPVGAQFLIEKFFIPGLGAVLGAVPGACSVQAVELLKP